MAIPGSILCPVCRPSSPVFGRFRPRFRSRFQLSGDADPPHSFDSFHLRRPVQSPGRPHSVRRVSLFWTQLSLRRRHLCLFDGCPRGTHSAPRGLIIECLSPLSCYSLCQKGPGYIDHVPSNSKWVFGVASLRCVLRHWA
jgi:hypothetical protein